MKTYFAVILGAVLVAGCASKQPPAYTDTRPAADRQSTPSKVGSSPPGESAVSQSGAPIEFTYFGLTPDKQSISYKIKVNTDKQISQVDLAVKEVDANGKVLLDTTMLWQNIVKSVGHPIEKGKTYDVQDYLYPGATKAECKLKRVVFQDGTSWSPK